MSMEKLTKEQMNYLDASIKTAQYLAGLTAQQDVWSETGKVLVNFFGADMGGFGERGADGEIAGRNWTFAERFSGRKELEAAGKEAIAEVLESGFLTLRIIFTPESLSLAFLPITRENRVISVMLVGHAISEPLPKELLNLYLAVAGLVGTTASRLASELEVRRHRQNLEQLVKERTAELTNANEHLRLEITQRNLAEEELRRERDNLTAIFEAMEDDIYIVNQQGYIQYGNSALEKDFGPYAGRKCHEYFYDSEEPCSFCHIKDVLAGKTMRWERYFPKSGKTYDTIETPLREADEVVKMTIFRDISNRKKLEDALKKARDAAEAANRAKSAFLTNMSHELRTPLNAILGFTQIMCRDDSMSESTRKNLAIVNRSGEHLLSMINDLLDLSKIEAGKTELTVEPFDLPRTIEDVVGMIRFRASSKGLDVVLDLDSGIDLPVRADLGKFRQVLINLLGNAVKFTEKGRVTVRGHTTSLGDIPCRRLLEIEVEDTGPGIAAEKMGEIFDPFTQAGPENTSRKGTGLGLTISRSFAQLMDGELTVESEEGKGSIFRLRIPVDVVTEFEAQSAGTPPPEVMGMRPGSQYCYNGEDPRKLLLAAESIPAAAPNSTELAALPRETVRRIREAAMELNKEEILAIAAVIQGKHPTVASFIKGEVVSYNFEAIEKLLKSTNRE